MAMKDLTIYDYNLNLVSNEKKLYILGCGNEARQFAVRLLNPNIYFHGFISLDSAMKQKVTLFNKLVININDCAANDDICIIAPYSNFLKAEKDLSEFSLQKKLVKIETLSPYIEHASNIVIYGCGSRAKSVFEDYRRLFDITFFVDSFEKNWGGEFCTKKIISPQELCALPGDTAVIIGSSLYEEIYDNLKKYNIEDDRIFYIDYTLKCYGVSIKNFSFCIHVISDAYQKKSQIILYGQKEIVESVQKKFGLLDIHDIEIVDRDCAEEDGTIFQLSYYDWDNTICVLTDDISEKSMDMLEGAGIPGRCLYWLKDFQQYNCYDCTRKFKYIPDPTLGFSVVSLTGGVTHESDYPSFIKYEYADDECSGECVILVLGGSTSQSFFAREVSWSECLSKLLTEKKVPHKIFCGAVGGYSNIQEFLKLARDGISLSPDIVLSYSGANNMNWSMCSDYPFIHSYQRELFEWIKETQNIKNSYFVSDTSSYQHVNYGISVQDYDPFQYWLLYERFMNSMCRELSIKFKAYLQPMLFSKLSFDEEDRRILLGIYKIVANSIDDICCCSLRESTGDDLNIYETIKKAVIFRKRIVTAREQYSDWLIDLSDIMDHEHDIYMDDCHVYEKGNQIIASHIYETIKEDISEVLKQKISSIG